MMHLEKMELPCSAHTLNGARRTKTTPHATANPCATTQTMNLLRSFAPLVGSGRANLLLYNFLQHDNVFCKATNTLSKFLCCHCIFIHQIPECVLGHVNLWD